MDTFIEDMKKEKIVKGIRRAVNMLGTVYPEGMDPVRQSDGWEQVKLYVDSGATEAVVGPDMLCSVKTVEGTASQMGVKYETANGVRILNLGEKKFVAVAEDGVARSITAQVCDVNKALLSVSRLAKQGYRVVFDTDSFIEDKTTGEKMWLTEEGGMYALNLWEQGGF